MLRPTNPCKIAVMAVALVFCAACWLPAQTAPAPAPPPRPAPTPEQLAIQAASEKDHQRMMDLLGIKELCPGASASGNGPNPVNYDESKADIYPSLPDPLLLNDGKRVTSGKAWWKQRRPADRRALRPRNLRPRSRASARRHMAGREHQAG